MSSQPFYHLKTASFLHAGCSVFGAHFGCDRNVFVLGICI
ncbi:hypothetical protein C1A50_4387 [Paenibacillus polymyxa]|nr:hypothetical protein C1A50_4387 [Paenibacillus polymyxa]